MIRTFPTEKVVEIMNNRNIDVIIRNMKTLVEQYNDAASRGELDEERWWNDEYGTDLTDSIDCHPVFIDSSPCLGEARNIEYGTAEWYDCCKECKALWLFEKYE